MKRSEVATEYKWDLEAIYATDEEWEKEFAQVKSQVEEITKFKGTLNSVEKVKELFTFSDALDITLSRLYSYAHMRKDENSAKAKSFLVPLPRHPTPDGSGDTSPEKSSDQQDGNDRSTASRRRP